nr:MAG TPA: hypothetical protein [Caudoviricetes sp.]
MSIKEWAKKEVELACKHENPDRKEGEFDYGCACYESALKAFNSLCDDEHLGFSIKMTQAILNRLIDMQPLTPIEDTDDAWNICSRPKYGLEVYQCKRMSSLFKNVYTDGTIEYHDNNLSYCVDINNPNVTYSSGLVRRIINEMYPITMPYMPGKPIKVYCEDFLVDKKNGDFDTIGIFYAIKTENGEQQKIEINRFFREPEGDEEGRWTEISKKEYYERKEKRIHANN